MKADIDLDTMRHYSNRAALYGGRAKESFHIRFRVSNLVCSLLPDFASGAVRTRLYRWAGFRIGSGAFIMGNINISGGAANVYERLMIGQDTVVSNHVTVNLDAPVAIGNNVTIGPYAMIYTGTHRTGSAATRCVGAAFGKPVCIEDGCWIRLAAIILPGVTIGCGSIVGAGAVVARDVPPNSYVEGNPAKVVRQLSVGER